MADEEGEIDIGALRKRLRDEYAFVNKQKQDLQKEYNNIVTTGDSLLRGLWIVGQQWRYLYRLRGGPKFAAECAYTSNLLDSIQFQDGYAQVGFKEVKYGNFLREFRENSEVLKSILILADQLGVNTSAFVKTIISSIYGSCLFPRDEKAVLTVVKSIIQYHLVYSANPLNIFSRDRNSFVNILEVLSQTCPPCRAFLVLACQEVVFDILLDGSLYWTVEEQELLSVMDVREVRKKFGDPGTPGTTERIKDHMMRCWVALADTVYALLKKINDALMCIPDMLLYVVSCFYKFALKRGFNDLQAKQMVMRFFFNQVITPLLLRPQPFLIDTEIRASPVAMFNLKKITLIIQTLVSIETGDDVSHLSQEATQFYDNLDKGPLHEIANNLVEQLPKEGDMTLSDEESMPGIARTSVLISKTDLDSLVTLLCQLKHFAATSQQSLINTQSSTKQIINPIILDKLLGNLEGIQSVTSDMARVSFSTQNAENEQSVTMQKALQAFKEPLQENEVVLVISLGISTIECPGMVPEEKVLGMPTPQPRRKSTIKDAIMNHVNELNENSQLSDSESGESSSDEKSPEAKPEDVDSADDVLEDGFEDDFVAFRPRLETLQPEGTTTNPFASNVDPFADFDSPLPPLEKNDPFISVIRRSPEQPALILAPSAFEPSAFAPSELKPSELKPSELKSSAPPPSELKPTAFSPLGPFAPSSISPVTPPLSLSPSSNQRALIDLGDLESSSSPDLRSSSSTSGVTSDGFLNSSGSQSSVGSDKRLSSSASSSSDSGKTITSPPKKEQNTHKKEKKEGSEVVRRKSLKENLQNVISHTVISPKREKKKSKSSTLFHKKRRRSKKAGERLIDTHSVATIIAAKVENEKTPKVICDEIMLKYASIKNNRPNIVQSNVTMETAHVSRDDEDVMRDAKNKLRLVLSNGSGPVFPAVAKVSSSGGKSEKASRALVTYLKRDLADAITSQDCTMLARLHETLSTLEKLSLDRFPQMLHELQQDYLTRKAYLSYLVRAHQGLVGTRQFLEKALERVERERDICRRYLMTQCVNMFMTNQREKLDSFVTGFGKLQMSDEKSEEMKSFIQTIKEEFQRDSLWLGSNEQQQEEAFDAVERKVISRVYSAAVYAFGETDRFRDDVFHERVNSMCNSIGEDFALLEIKEEFQNEAPWFPAQNELHSLSAYKTPKDKLKCIQRCCTIIMSLLGMSSGDAVGADAFTPVLIYVVMHANPRGLLTTVDFINNYLNETLTGEQYYCWMQFCSAIQFIKILLEEHKSTLGVAT